MALALTHAGFEHLAAQVEHGEAQVRSRGDTQTISIGQFESGTTDNGASTRGSCSGDSFADPVQPRKAIGIIEGMPAAILATLTSECSVSPSINGTPHVSASMRPTVDLPDPLTPMTMNWVDMARVTP